jgi:hypothetical protein
MKRVTDDEIARLLRTPRHGAPPAGLAERIKAEIPEYLEVGGRSLGPQARGFRRLRLLGSRPVWLLAASLLVVIGVGFVAVQLYPPARNLAREIALDGVVVPQPYEIVVPPRWSLGSEPTPEPSPGPPLTPAAHTTPQLSPP